MKQFEAVFLEILKAGMWGERPQVSEGFDEWESVVRLAKSQSVLGVVAQVMLSDEDVSSHLPQDMKARLKKFLMNNLLTHNLLNNTLIKVVSTLREGGVESVLLKGQGLARNYPQPELRQCGDIDLYVGLENAEKAHDLLSPIAEKVDAKATIDHYKHYHVIMPGGVEVEVLDDFTGIDSSLVKGEKVILSGQQALKYVRSREGLEDSTNSTRMLRQKQYVKALYEKALKLVESDEEFVVDASVKMSDYIVSDRSVTQLQELMRKMSTYEFEGIKSFEGENKMGDEFVEFYPTKDSVEDIVIDLFYEEKK